MYKTTLSHEHISNRLKPKRILLAGDLMLDQYTLGTVQRISPEAPVPVLWVTQEHQQAGGAGNALLNLLALGMEVRVLGRVGADAAGQQLLTLLQQRGAQTTWCLTDPTCPTPRKNRVMAGHHQIVRVDHENNLPLATALEETLIAQLPQLLSDVDVIAISDYAKGFLTPRLLRALIDQATVPVIVDPKGRDFARYAGATLLKPNVSEAIAAAGDVTTELSVIADRIFQVTGVQYIVITRSHEGISLFEPGHPQRDFPAYEQRVRDVTGAGDTVLATLVAALANDLSLPHALELSNLAAAIAVSRPGCAHVTRQDLLDALEPVQDIFEQLLSR